MASMKTAIANAAEFLGVPLDALTDYMLDRDPPDAAVTARISAVQDVARDLNMGSIELLLFALDVDKAGD